jgi:hypothetical protein
MRVNDSDILWAVERLRDEWPRLFGDEAGTLAERLAAAPHDDSQAIRQAADHIVELLQTRPPARTRVGEELGVKGYHLRITRGEDAITFDYEPLPGKEDEIPAGTMMVCPVDATHYRRVLRQKGQRLYCPEHTVPLVPQE